MKVAYTYLKEFNCITIQNTLYHGKVLEPEIKTDLHQIVSKFEKIRFSDFASIISLGVGVQNRLPIFLKIENKNFLEVYS